jgi:tetratricopeptide (TPR) repeat protein
MTQITRPGRFAGARILLVSLGLAVALAVASPILLGQEKTPLQQGMDAYDKGDYDQAIADFNQAIQLDPKNAKAYYKRGNAYGHKDEYDKAIADEDQAIQIDPKYVDAYLNRGWDYSSKGDYGKAVADCDQAILIDPKDAHAYNDRAWLYSSKGDYAKAIADCDQAIQLDPKNAQAYGNRGWAHGMKGDYDQAISDLDQAIQLDPKLKNVYYSRGWAYSSKGDYDQAISDLDQAIQLNPKLKDAYYSRAMAYGMKGEYDKAIADYSQAIQLDPKSAKAYDNLAWLLATCPQANFRDGKKAVAYATKSCELSAWKDPVAVDVLAAACAEVGDFDNAVKWESQYLATPNLSINQVADAQSRAALYQANQPYHQPEHKGDHDKAIADYSQTIQLDPKNVNAYNNRGIDYDDKGDYDKAIADYNQGIQLDPKNALAYNNLALLLATCPEASFRDGKKAVEYATKACELTDWKNPGMVETLAAACAEAGDFDNAIKWQNQYQQTLYPKGKVDEIRDSTSRLWLYGDHKPYHATPSIGEILPPSTTHEN